MKNATPSLRFDALFSLVVVFCVVAVPPIHANYTPVTSISLQARDPATNEVVAASGEEATPWGVGDAVKLRAILSENRAEVPISFAGKRGADPNVVQVWSDVAYPSLTTPWIAEVNVTITSTGTTRFTAVDSSGRAGVPDTVSNIVRLVHVGVARVVVADVAPEDEGGIWTAAGLPLKLRAIPEPADAPWPDGYPAWVIVTQPEGSTLLNPASDSGTARLVPVIEGNYFIRASCGTMSDGFEFTAVESQLQRDVAGGSVDFVDMTPALRSVLIGQKMNFKVDPTLPAGVQATEYSWTLNGVNFKNWEAGQTTATLTPMVADDLNDETVHFYWTDPEVARGLTCAVTLNNGKKLYVRDEIQVKAPTVTFTTTLGATQLNAAKTRLGLFATAASPHGITYTGKVEVPDGCAEGRWNWVQLLSPKRYQTLDPTNVKQEYSLNGTWVLDTDYPYEPTPYGVHPGVTGSYATGALAKTNSDSPSEPLHAGLKSTSVIDENFTMTIMFLPPGEESRYVPTKRIEWDWSGAATKGAGGAWTLTAGSTDQNVSDADDTTEHPVWSANVRSGRMVNSPAP